MTIASKIILLFFIATFTSCASSPDAQAHRLALWNFTYQKDKVNEYRIYNSISGTFSGDCEDFAFTLQRVIGGDVWYVSREEKQSHAVLVKDDLVYDSLSRHVTSKDSYNGIFVFIMTPTLTILNNQQNDL